MKQVGYKEICQQLEPTLLTICINKQLTPSPIQATVLLTLLELKVIKISREVLIFGYYRVVKKSFFDFFPMKLWIVSSES